jgi:hypothetical protein
MPRFAQVLAELSRDNLLALARASRAVASFRDTRVTAGRREMAAINALVRIAICGAALPER